MKSLESRISRGAAKDSSAAPRLIARSHIRAMAFSGLPPWLQSYGAPRLENPGLQPLHMKARLLANDIGRVTFEHVGRALNAHADRLANAAMDAASRT